MQSSEERDVSSVNDTGYLLHANTCTQIAC